MDCSEPLLRAGDAQSGAGGTECIQTSLWMDIYRCQNSRSVTMLWLWRTKSICLRFKQILICSRSILLSPRGQGFPGGSVGKESACNAGDLGLIPGLGRSPGGGHGNPLLDFYLENPHGQRSLVGCSPWGPKESDTIEWLTHTYIYTYMGLPWWLSGKESAWLCRRCRFDPWVKKIPWRRKW